MESSINHFSQGEQEFCNNRKGHRATLSKLLRSLIPIIVLLIHVLEGHAQWESLGNGLDLLPASVWAISAPDSITIWATTWDDINFVAYDEICKTTDGGENWEVVEVELNISEWMGSIFALDDQTAWVIGANLTTPPTGEIYKTSDGGESWVHQSTAFTGVDQAPTSIYFWNENEGLAFGGSDLGNTNALISIYRTVNGGNNWTEIPIDELPEQFVGEGMSNELGNGNHAVVGNHVWFPTTEGRVFYSDDRGMTWSVADTELSESAPHNVVSIAMRDFLHGLLISDDPNKVYRTMNGGLTWEDTDFNNDIIQINQITYVPGTEGTYMMQDGWSNDANIALVSTDEGETWNIIDMEESVAVVEFLSPTVGFAGGYIYAEDDGGLFKWNNTDILLSTGPVYENTNIELFPVPVTDILQVKLAGNDLIAHIAIYDLLGKELLRQESSNTNQLNSVNVSDLESGTYMLEMVSSQSRATRQFVKY
jgi:photosystem II stability/assembly factor-like uncharacterized protein